MVTESRPFNARIARAATEQALREPSRSLSEMEVGFLLYNWTEALKANLTNGEGESVIRSGVMATDQRAEAQIRRHFESLGFAVHFEAFLPQKAPQNDTRLLVRISWA